ncbi:MAG: CAP domain-containing protein [Candidatus Doudnabacteria bacterium]|nr:CAP domain-containing protein [Candidatus Doudnabacteria bacterium]
MRTEVPIPPTPLVESVTTEIAKPALLASEDLLTPQDKLSTQSTKTTKQTTPAPKPSPQIKTQNVIEPTKSCGGNFTQEFLCLLNEYRVSKGIARLSYANDLANVAQDYSDWMSASTTFSHIDTNGNNFVGRCSVAGITCYAENLAIGFTSASNLLNMWQVSPSHDENLLRNLSSVGLGIKNGYATLLMR